MGTQQQDNNDEIASFVYSYLSTETISLLFCRRRVYPAAIVFNKLDQCVGGILHFNSTLYHRLRPSMPSIIQHQEQTSYHIFNPNLLSFSNWAWFLYLSESMLLMIHHGNYKMAEWWLFKPWRVGEIYAEQHQYHATETFLVVNKNKLFATINFQAWPTKRNKQIDFKGQKTRVSEREGGVSGLPRAGFYAVLKSTTLLLFVEFIYFKQSLEHPA